MSRLYFDHAASTPVAPQVLKAMTPYFMEKYGNPGSLHSFGQEAIAALDMARDCLANYLGVGFREIIFTGGATEANNLALRGSVKAWHSIKENEDWLPKVLVSAIEHESVLDTAESLAAEGLADVVILPVSSRGVVDTESVRKNLDERVALISIMLANNETGVIQPIKEIAKILNEFREQRRSETASRSPYPLFHTDAAQALQFEDCRPDELGVDLMTGSAHKMYGPKGIGFLYARSSRKDKPADSITSILTGGGQEFGLRSGTENVPLIVGLAAAVQYIEKDKAKQAARIKSMKDKFIKGMKDIYPKVKVNGAAKSLPHIANIWLPGKEAEEMLIRLDLAGIAVATGSACAARTARLSKTLLAMGFDENRTRQSLRISFGRTNTLGEVGKLLRAMKRVVA